MAEQRITTSWQRPSLSTRLANQVTFDCEVSSFQWSGLLQFFSLRPVCLRRTGTQNGNESSAFSDSNGTRVIQCQLMMASKTEPHWGESLNGTEKQAGFWLLGTPRVAPTFMRLHRHHEMSANVQELQPVFHGLKSVPETTIKSSSTIDGTEKLPAQTTTQIKCVSASCWC